MVPSIWIAGACTVSRFECAACYLPTAALAVGDVERDFQRTLEQCRRVTPETIRHEKLGYKLGGSLMKLVAPLL
ncbi:MAG: hypothetical protein ACLU38_01395 [Dysosmobacter sp.]